MATLFIFVVCNNNLLYYVENNFLKYVKQYAENISSM